VKVYNKPFVEGGVLVLANRLIDPGKNQANSGSKEDWSKGQNGGAGETVSIFHHRIARVGYKQDTNLPLCGELVSVVEGDTDGT